MIVATLVGQGLTLPWLIRRLGVVASTGPGAEETHARLAAVEAALTRLDELADEYPGHLELVDQLRARYDHEASHIWPHADGPRDEASRRRSTTSRSGTRSSTPSARRSSSCATTGVIGDEVLRRIERDLDLEALRSGV